MIPITTYFLFYPLLYYFVPLLSVEKQDLYTLLGTLEIFASNIWDQELSVFTV